jgi:hypothetical protein
MGREVAEQATKRRGRVRRFLAWLGYGPETEAEVSPDRDARRAKGKADAAKRRATRRAERLARKERAQPAGEDAQQVAVGDAPGRSSGPQAAGGPSELQERLVEMEARARSAEQQAEEARHGIGAISTKLAGVEAERRLHEQAERRLESRCAELRGELELERKEKAAIVEHFDRRLAAIEETAEAAAKRVAAAERELIKGSKRPWFDGGGRVERADQAGNGDPLGALEASIGKERPKRDGPARERQRPRDAREPSRTG